MVCAADIVPPLGTPSSATSNSKSETLSTEDSDGPPRRTGKTGGRNIYGNLHVAGIRVPAREGGVGMWFLFTVSAMSAALIVGSVYAQRGEICASISML